MAVRGADECQRHEFIGGSGNFEKLGCLRLHFLRSKGNLLQTDHLFVSLLFGLLSKQVYIM